MATITRKDMSMPRVRLKEGEDPTAKLKALYSAQQLDKPAGSVRVGRDGVISGSPTGFTGQTDEHQKNEAPENRHARNYDDDVGHGFPHDAGDTGRRPPFDSKGSGHRFKNPNPSDATGKDATKSPFSRAGRDFK